MRKFAEDAVATTYVDTEQFIFKVVHEFIAKYGGNFEDLVEHAGLCFMKAYLQFDPSRANFLTCLRWKVWRNLQELYRQRARHNKVSFIEFDPEVNVTPKQFSRLEFLDNLSEDARLVAVLAMDTAWELQPSPQAVRALLREYLKQPAIGWGAARIKQSFMEIRQALATQ